MIRNYSANRHVMPGIDNPLPLYIRSMLSAERCFVCHDGATKGEDVICPGCDDSLERESSWICPECGAKIRDCVCMTEQMKKAGVSAFVKLYPYLSDGSLVSSRLLYRLKMTRDFMLCRRMCAHLSVNLLFVLKAFNENAEDCIVTYIPRKRKRVIDSGTDQGRGLSKALAAVLHASSVPLISRVPGTVVQKTLDAQARLVNAEDSFDIKNPDRIKGRCVIIIDDLVTSGATMSGCASLLRKAGAGRVICASLSHTAGQNAAYFDPEAGFEPGTVCSPD